MMTFREVQKELTKNGWTLVRINGNAYNYKKKGYPKLVTIHRHGQKVSVGVLRKSTKDSGLMLLK